MDLDHFSEHVSASGRVAETQQDVPFRLAFVPSASCAKPPARRICQTVRFFYRVARSETVRLVASTSLHSKPKYNRASSSSRISGNNPESRRALIFRHQGRRQRYRLSNHDCWARSRARIRELLEVIAGARPFSWATSAGLPFIGSARPHSANISKFPSRRATDCRLLCSIALSVSPAL